ncbi:cadherin-23-like [Glandiceps talaboti]
MTAATKLDRELKDSYDIYVVASDKGRYPRSTAVPVTIDILDINDNLPVFSQSNYQGDVDEGDAAVGSGVVTVQSTDDDSPPNDDTAYLISDGNDGGHFEISANGEISVKTAINLETDGGQFILEVTAYNVEPFYGVGSNNTVNVTITVQDINNNGPVFPNDTYTTTISEDVAIETTIITVTAVDRDPIPSDMFYWISDGNDGGHFEINPSSGDISVVGGIDRDPPNNQTFFTLTIVVSDGDGNTDNDTCLMYISITDANDNEPVFGEVEYNFRVNENATVNTNVGMVMATDKDDGFNGDVVSYEIENGDGVFVIDNSTGEIFLTRVLDPGVKQYTYTIKAMDGGNPPRSGTIGVVITVNDVNDNSPRYLDSSFNFTVYENSRSGVVINKVEAIDDDGDSVQYSIQNSASVPFMIDVNTGELIVSGDLDRETNDEYNLVTVVTDGTFTESVDIMITILDENDNSPVFEKSVYSGNITEDANDGSEILEVMATDVDLDTNADIVYSIHTTSDNGDNIFGIHGNNGSIFIQDNTELDYELRNSYVITVQATDQPLDGKSRSAVVNVFVNVLDINDIVPMFEKAIYTANIDESAALDTSVLQMLASDPDTVGNLVYSIDDESSTFVINNISGVIQTAATLNREEQDVYIVSVSVTDGIYSTSVNLTINIDDVNDNAPVFDYNSYIFNATEGLDNETIGSISATDKDLGRNAEILYSFMPPFDMNGYFTVDSTGILSTGVELDRETQDVYQVYVVASDNGESARSTVVLISITVVDINDNLPVFSQDGIYEGDLDEGGDAVGMVIIILQSTDDDSPPNDDTAYLISDGNDGGHFEISTTGEISVKTAINLETDGGQFILEVTAYNVEPYVGSGNNNSKNVIINVQDINDHGPVFLNDSYLADVSEHSTVGVTVVTVTAEDPDPTLSDMTYFIDAGNDQNLFSVHPTNGDITIIGDIDRDPPNYQTFFNLSVTVSDGDITTPDDTTVVEITVSDINDNSPVFKQGYV